MQCFHAQAFIVISIARLWVIHNEIVCMPTLHCFEELKIYTSLFFFFHLDCTVIGSLRHLGLCFNSSVTRARFINLEYYKKFGDWNTHRWFMYTAQLWTVYLPSAALICTRSKPFLTAGQKMNGLDPPVCKTIPTRM